MNIKFRSKSRAILILLAFALLLPGSAAFASGTVTYEVTIENLSSGQPFSPPVAATHRAPYHIFRVGRQASPEIEAIAENGNQIPLFNVLESLARVTDAVNVGMPLTPNGTVVGGFTDTVTFEIEGRPRDRFSLATMLICTNDGITGLDGAALPAAGSVVYMLNGYDAGTEDNSEASADIVDPCSALGPLGLDGDPNGNENAAVDSRPHARIHLHPGIQGGSDLSAAAHGWVNPLARVTITRLSN